MKAWKCEYLLNHCTNFLVWFTTNFYEFQIIERIYDDPIAQNAKNLENLQKTETWKCEYLPSHVTNFSVWFTTTFYEFFKSLRGYMMILSPKIKNLKFAKNCEKLETWKCEYLPSRVRNFSVWFKTTFYIYFKSLRGSTMILSPKIT